MTRAVRRLIAIIVLTASFFLGTAGVAGAGEACGELRLLRPLNRVQFCVPTN